MPEGLKELYVDELKDIYNAENQLLKALPKMAKAASSEELRQGFEEHLKVLASGVISQLKSAPRHRALLLSGPSGPSTRVLF